MPEWQALDAMTAKYTLPDYAFQFVTVTAGVLIALLINELVVWKQNHDLVTEARTMIRREIADNRKDLDATVSGFPRDREAMEASIAFATDLLATGKTAITSIQLHYNMADLSDTSWRTAERTGALGHMDYGEVQRLSKLYDFQEVFVLQQRAILSQLALASSMLHGQFDPDKPNLKDLETFRARVMELSAAVRIQEDLAKRLVANYAEALQQE
jgi:hypothetical protein